jgi:hypothetical protein
MTATPLRLAPIREEEELSTNIRQIGPVMAKKMLERNVKNRAPKPAKVAQYAADMEAGRWLFDGAPIRFGADGTLLDGQNRLLAVIAADVTVPFLVVYGLPTESQAVMDGGAARTSADNLHISGEKNAAALASLCKQAVLYSTDRLDKNINYSVSSIEQKLFLAANPELREATDVATKLKSSIEARPTAIAFVFWLLMEKDYQAACEFFSLLATRANLPTGSPILALDSRLRNLRKMQQRSTFKQEANLLIKAWNAWRSGKAVGSMFLPRASDPLMKVHA